MCRILITTKCYNGGIYGFIIICHNLSLLFGGKFVAIKAHGFIPSYIFSVIMQRDKKFETIAGDVDAFFGVLSFFT